MKVLPFGEKVHYERLAEEGCNKLGTPWEQGVWLGHARGSNDVLVGTKEGVVRAWATKRNIEGE